MTQVDGITKHDGRVGGVGASALPDFRRPLFLMVVPMAVTATLLPLLIRSPSLQTSILVLILALLCTFGAIAGFIGGYRPMLSLFSIFTFSWLAVPSAYQVASGTAAWGDSMIVRPSPEVTSALLVLIVSVCSMYLGYWRGSRSQPHSFCRNSIRSNRLLGLAAILAIAALALLPIAAAGVGGFSNLFASRSEVEMQLADAGLTTSVSGGGAVAIIRILPSALAASSAALCVWYVVSSRFSARRVSPLAGLIMLLAIGALIVFANPFANTRFTFLAAAGPMLLLAFYPRCRKSGIVMTLVALFGLLIAYPLANAFRGGAASSRADDLLASLASADFDGFQQAINAVIFVQDAGHSGGKYLFSAALFFVPRSIWTDKAFPASIDVATNRGYSFTNLSLPIQSEVWVDLGWLGMVMVFFAIGFGWSKLDGAWSGRTHLAPVTAVLAVAQIGLIRGPLGAQLPVVAVAIAVVAVGTHFASSRAFKLGADDTLVTPASTVSLRNPVRVPDENGKQ